mmetsp:Transcript_75792/g.222249  ORF Transcript_75792/g.222249 Transcript_75792/m.222249 type:complete len:129 (-) Transcript_75792:246-632(-)
MDCMKKLVVGLCTEKDCALPPGINAELSGVPLPPSAEAKMWCAGKDCAEGRGSLKDVGGGFDGTAAGPYPDPPWPLDGETELATTCTELPNLLVLGCVAGGVGVARGASAGARTALPFGHRLCVGDVE